MNVEDILQQILAELKSVNQRLDALEKGQQVLRSEMDKQFAEVKNEIRIVREQTAQNTEVQATVNEVREEVDDLKLDVKILKKMVMNQ